MDIRDALSSEILEDGWRSLASCLGVDPDLFFPERGETAKPAKAVCQGCLVREDCLEYSLTNKSDPGIWGGTSERERRKILRQRASQAKSK